MSIKSINDISKIYVDQIIESTNYETDMKEAIGGLRSREERMARMITPAQRKQQDRVRKGKEVLADIQATEKALKAPKSSPETKPEYNTPEAEVRVLKPGQKKDTVALKAKKIIGEAKKEKPKRWWDDDGDGIGYEPEEVGGKFKRKKKVKKESYSNWREDLSEVVEAISKDKNDQKIVERAIDNNKIIKINPTVSEAIESLGGALIEMEEFEDFEGILDELSESEIFLLSDHLIEEVVEELFYECIEEGYDIEEIENVIIESLEISTSLLTEEEDVKSSKLDKVKSAVKKVGKGLARGVGYAAGAAVRGAKAIGREVRSGYAKGRAGASSASPSRSSASPSRSNRGSEKVVKRGPGLLSRIGSSLKSGLKRVVAKGARKIERGASKVAARMERGKTVTPDDKTPSPAHSRSGPLPAKRPPSGAGQKEKLGGPSPTQPKKKPAEKPADPWEGSATTPSKPKPKPAEKPAEKPADPWEGSATTPKRVVKAKPKATTKTTKVTPAPSPSEKPKRSRKKKSENPQKKGAPSLDDLLKSEEVQLSEKTLTAAEKSKREEIAKSMNLSDFERRYPGRGMEVKMATATKMAKRIAEQSMPEKSEQSGAKPPNPSAVSQVLQAKQKTDLAQKELAMKQRMASQKGVNLTSLSS